MKVKGGTNAQASCFLAFMTSDIASERESESGRDEEEHLISIVFMSHCRDSEWLRESKEHGREGRRRTERGKEPAQHFPEARAEEREAGGPGKRKKADTVTQKHLSQANCFPRFSSLSLFADSLGEVNTAG